MLCNISLKIGDETSAPYKSIQRIVWDDIPPFAVLTGLNGSGKTQLLRAMAYRLSGVRFDAEPLLNQMPLSFEGDTVGPDEIAYWPSSENSFNVQGSSLGNLQQIKHQFLQQLAPESARNNIEMQIMRERVQRKYGLQISSQQISPEMIAKLPDDFLYMLQYSDVAGSLSHVFLSHQIRRAQMLMDTRTDTEIEAGLGKAPWILVNEAFEAAEFSFRVVPPTNDLLSHYSVKMVSTIGNVQVDLNDLSSGEKTILRTILWFYNSKHNNIYPKLFLLDEPDAHLHPSMTRQFLNVLNDVLVNQYNVRVILTTHSPSTVALAPDGAIFVMSRGNPVIERPTSKAQAIGLLTAGLVIVSAGSKFVLVEDEDDVDFHGAVRDVLADQGPSRDAMALKPAPSIVFLPSSVGKGADKVGGGKSVVVQWIEKFDGPPLDEMFRGIIDRDVSNVGGPRVQVLGRYSAENYQVDPFVLFGLLIEEQKAPKIAGVGISSGDEHLLRELPVDALQRIVDYIAQQVEPTIVGLPAAEKVKIDMTFTNGITVQYPAWMINRRGHDLMRDYQKVFGQNVVIRPRLNKVFRRVRLVSRELAAIFAQIQYA